MKRCGSLLIVTIVAAVLAGCGIGGGGNGQIGGSDLSFTLTIEKEGEGEVFPSPGQYEHDQGKVVSIEATPDEDWHLQEWLVDGSSYSDEKTVEVAADRDRTVRAVFAPDIAPVPTYELTVHRQGDGSTEPQVGSHGFPQGEPVPLTVIPAAGWEFKEWIGDVDDPTQSDTTILMDSDKTVTAVLLDAEGPPAEVSGHALAGLTEDPAADQAVVVLGREGNTILSTFLIDDMEGRLDSSKSLGAAFWENQIEYLLDISSGARLLYYADSGSKNHYAEDALSHMGLDFTKAASQTHLREDLQTGSYDIVIIDTPWIDPDTQTLDSLQQYALGGGLLALSTFWMHVNNDHELWQTLNYEYSESMTTPQNVYQWVEHDIFQVPNALPAFEEWEDNWSHNVFPGTVVDSF